MRPDPKEGFNKADVNGDGGLDKTEMQTVLDNISKMSGQDVNVDDIFSDFDEDENGVLNEAEAEAAMAQLREEMGPPPMGPPPQNSVNAYTENGENSYLIELLNSLEEEEESLLDSLTDSEEDEDDEESPIVDMLQTAMKGEAYSPLDVLA